MVILSLKSGFLGPLVLSSILPKGLIPDMVGLGLGLELGRLGLRLFPSTLGPTLGPNPRAHTSRVRVGPEAV